EKPEAPPIDADEWYAVGRELASDREHRPVAADHDRELRFASHLCDRRSLVAGQRRMLRGFLIEQYAMAAAGEKRGEPAQRFCDPGAAVTPDQRDRRERMAGPAHGRD